MPLERTPERSKRVAIGDFMLAVVLAVVGAVTGIWFAYIAAAAALLFAAFVWVRASREINGRGAYGPVRQSTASASTSGAARSSGSAT
ncbi:MAG: hypothetical protein WA794_02050 [Trebonia sp.]